MRQFSIPFNNIPFEEYKSILYRYDKNLIHSIYLSIPEINEHLYEEKEEDVSKDLLKNTLDYKRMVVYNHGMYPYEDKEIFKHLEKIIFPLIEKYRIDGFIVTNINVSRFLKQIFPNLELHLSCNNPVFTLRQALSWLEHGMVDIINPPREAGRTPTLLKEFHEHGIKQKILVNNACTYGCPNQLNHTCSNGFKFDNNFSCTYNDNLKWLQNCLILPRWLDKLDKWVNIYKIAGRYMKSEMLIPIMDAYINKANVNNLKEFAHGGSLNTMYQIGYNIPLDLYPDKLLYCETKQCDTCSICKQTIKKIHEIYGTVNNDNSYNTNLYCNTKEDN